MKSITEAALNTEWRQFETKKYKCALQNASNLAILYECFYSAKHGIGFKLYLNGPVDYTIVKFNQSSIPQFRNGKDLYENVLEYAETIAKAHQSLMNK